MDVGLLAGLSLLLTHELDAMTAKEWRIFPGLSRLDDDAGRWWFVLLHVPLFGVLLWGMFGPNQEGWRLGFEVFLVGHMIAHMLLHRHPENGFRRPLSWVFIGGAGVVGIVELASRFLL